MSSVLLRSIASTQSQDVSRMGADPMALLDADMRHVLDVLATLEPKPFEHLTPAEARAQPTPMAALRQILRERPDTDGVGMELRMIPGAAGELRARVYTPVAVDANRRPLILYLHGGYFTVGDLDRDDETPPALARRCRAIVVSVHTRQAPEHRFPAAHEDAAAAWRWMLAQAESLGGDARRTAIVGEDAGANLAVNVALGARADGGPRPRHLALITPMASAELTRTSHIAFAGSRPLDTASLRWAYRQLAADAGALDDPRIELASRSDLAGLPPTTIVLAGSDPLRSEGEALADALRRSGVWVDATTYDGVTAQFFGLARIVNKAMFAQGQVTRNLEESLG